MSEEGTTEESRTGKLGCHIKEAPFFCKIIELILCIISVSLIVSPIDKIPSKNLNMNHIALFFASVPSYIYINAILIANYLKGEHVSKKVNLGFTFWGAILCCAAGAVIIHDWTRLFDNLIMAYLERNSNQMIASGVFALLASLTFVIDYCFTRKYAE